MSKKVVIAMLLVCALFLTPPVAYAGVGVASSVDAASGRFARGFANVLAGWAEIPHEIDRVGVEKGFLTGFAEGLLRGTYRTVVRTLVGAYELSTFYLEQEPLVEEIHTWEWQKVTKL